MPDIATLRLRLLRPDDLPWLSERVAEEGWNPGLHDGTAFLAADPHGFLIGECSGEPVSVISAVAYGDSFGFVGHYIVRPEWRGNGLGLATWNAALVRLNGRNIGLDGVLARQTDYAHSGFSLSHYHSRQQLNLHKQATPAGLVPLPRVPFDDLVLYDERHFPAIRTAFLRAWVHLPESVGLARIEDGSLRGYAVMRRCLQGWKVGPLFADERRIAESLLQGLAADAGSDPVYLDIPDATWNPAAEQVARTFDGQEVFRCARMYTQGAPKVERDHIFGVTTLELG